MEICGNPRAGVTRKICIYVFVTKYTVNLATLPGTWYSRSYLGVLNLVMMTHDLCVPRYPGTLDYSDTLHSRSTAVRSKFSVHQFVHY